MGTRALTRILASLLLTLGVASATVPARAAAAPATRSIASINDWSCTPTRAHPSPAVIVHGTFGDSMSLLGRLSASLRRAGYCVFAIDYGNRATGPIEQSAAQLKTFVDRVLAATGAAKVSMVGHSQGGMMPRYYIKFLGGAGKVDDLVGLSPSNHGTANPLTLTPGLGYLCPACAQQRTGSSFLRHLNAGDETPGAVSYTNVVTRYDEVVLPYTSGYLRGANTTNLTLQNKCPLDVSDHLLIPLDGPAIRLTLNALGRRGPASPTYRPSCLP
jgi:triacylglycerol esterase/lipase EstA (alpha/beta hydrolase family)